MIGSLTRAVIYISAFLIGAVLMGFEMLGSRYLYPYFGGGIGTWAGLISMVLVALTIGYFAGGNIVDRYPSALVIAVATGIAALYLAVVPATADGLMMSILNSMGDGPYAILAAAAALILVPVSLLGMLSPVCVRLLIRSTEQTGRTSGLIYGISTIGNVFGTLFTTFTLIPWIGSRAITYVFCGVLIVCALSLFAVSRQRP
ncbi:MAG: fused MFS/spermidine synthase [Proteobacteria bacterium]|nr:fused MFS/spermidine synthase [Pseudomonadota bacterium]